MWTTGAWFNIDTSSYLYRTRTCREKSVVRLPYLHGEIRCTGMKASLCRNAALCISAYIPQQNMILPRGDQQDKYWRYCRTTDDLQLVNCKPYIMILLRWIMRPTHFIHDIYVWVCVWAITTPHINMYLFKGAGLKRIVLDLILAFLPEVSFGLRVLSVSVCVCVCVCACACQLLAFPRDNSWPVQARITKFGSEL